MIDLSRIRAAFSKLRRDYKATFGSASGKRVLVDLGEFAHMSETGYHDARDAMLILAGRREMFMRMCDFAQLTPEEYAQAVVGRLRAQGVDIPKHSANTPDELKQLL